MGAPALRITTGVPVDTWLNRSTSSPPLMRMQPCEALVPIEPMVELQATLRGQGTPTYIFSNTNDLAVGHIRQSFPFFSNFDGYIFSYEHGAMKPQPKLYEVVERDCGYRKGDILYLDDRPENVEAGAARGWQVILHESAEKTREAISKLGLLSER